MTITIIILSLIFSYLLFRLYAKRENLDNSKVLSNRKELRNLAIDDWEHGKITRELFHTLSFVFHPDFKNTWDYVPPERQAYTRQMYQLDSNFWKSYKLTPDFVIPANMVYELYKGYICQHIIDNLKSHRCSELNISSQTEGQDMNVTRGNCCYHASHQQIIIIIVVIYISMEISKSNIQSEQQLVDDLRYLIDETRRKVTAGVNAGIATMYWQIGERINREVLGNQRAAYGKRIVSTVSTQLSQSHFVEVLPLENNLQREFYLTMTASFGCADYTFQLETLCKSSTQKFLSVETFINYKKSLETRLNSIERKLCQGFCLQAINLYSQKPDKGYRSILAGLRNLKDIEIDGPLPFLVFLFLDMFVVYLISSITN